MFSRIARVFLVFAVILPLTFCGGGSSSSPTPSPTLSSVSVSPHSVTLAAGQTQQFTATANYSDGSTRNVTSTATWTATPAGMISFTSPGAAKALIAGDVTVQASLNSKSDSTSFTIGPAILSSLSVTPSSSSLYLGDSVQLHATGTYSDGTTADLTTSATWSSSDATVASVATRTGWNGFLTARSSGHATLSATSGSVSNTAAVSVAAAVARFVYATNHDATVSAFTTTTSGTLVANGYLYTGSSPSMPGASAIAADKFLYVTDAHANIVRSYALDATTGRLQSISAPLTTGNFPSSVVVAGAGKFLYTANYLGGNISGFSIAANGVLNSVTDGVLPVVAARLGADPAGKFLYVSDGNNSFAAYRIASDGQLSQAANVITGGKGSRGIVVDPSGQFLITADSSTFTLTTFTVNSTGTLTASGSPTSLAGAPLAIAMDPGGTYVYVLENLSPGVNSVNAFSVNPATGALSDAGLYQLWADPIGLSADPSGKIVYISTMNNDLIALGVHSGNFTLLQDMRGRGIPFSLAIARDVAPVQVTPKFVYGIGAGGAAVHAYSLSASTGALAELSNSPYVSGGAGLSLSMHPTGSYLYAANYWTNKITAYSTDPSTGALAQISTATLSNGPYQMAIEPSGRFLYASDDYSTVRAFSIDAATGNLSALSPVVSESSPNGPGSIAINPAGSIAYVANESGDSLSGFTIDPATGAWTEIGSDLSLEAPSGNYPRALTFDPSGRYLFVAMQCAYWANSCLSNALLAYYVHPDGSLTSFTGSPFAVGNSPISVAVDATGHFVYVASDGIYGLSLDPIEGLMTSMPSSFGPGSYAWLFPEASGNFLLRGDDNGMTVYRIDPTSGALTSTSTVPLSGGGGIWSCVVSYSIQ